MKKNLSALAKRLEVRGPISGTGGTGGSTLGGKGVVSGARISLLVSVQRLSLARTDCSLPSCHQKISALRSERDGKMMSIKDVKPDAYGILGKREVMALIWLKSKLPSRFSQAEKFELI